MTDEIMTVKQVAEYLKLSVRSIHKLIVDKNYWLHRLVFVGGLKNLILKHF